jgi:hypothetical protein
MPLVFIIFVVLILLLTGTFVPVLFFFGCILAVILGIWLLWRFFVSPFGLILLAIGALFLLPLLPKELFTILCVIAAFCGLVALVNYFDRPPPRPQLSPDERRAERERSREEDRLYEEHKQKRLEQAELRGE